MKGYKDARIKGIRILGYKIQEYKDKDSRI